MHVQYFKCDILDIYLLYIPPHNHSYKSQPKDNTNAFTQHRQCNESIRNKNNHINQNNKNHEKSPL